MSRYCVPVLALLLLSRRSSIHTREVVSVVKVTKGVFCKEAGTGNFWSTPTS